MSEQTTQVVNPLQSPPAPQETKPKDPVTPDVASMSDKATDKPAQTDEMRSRFAALAKKERIARLAQHNLKTKEAQILERERKIAERERLWDDEFKQSPLEAIKKRGYTYEDITKAALNDGKFEPATEIKSVKEEIEKLRQEQADKEKKALEAQQLAQKQAEQEAIDNFKSKIVESIEANKEKYELTQLFDASDLVFQTVEEHFSRTKKVLSIPEACDLVEQYLESEIERTATSSKKFQAKYNALKAKETTGNQGKSQSSANSVTLSNNLTAATASLLPAHTEADRIKRALAALG